MNDHLEATYRVLIETRNRLFSFSLNYKHVDEKKEKNGHD